MGQIRSITPSSQEVSKARAEVTAAGFLFAFPPSDGGRTSRRLISRTIPARRERTAVRALQPNNFGGNSLTLLFPLCSSIYLWLNWRSVGSNRRAGSNEEESDSERVCCGGQSRATCAVGHVTGVTKLPSGTDTPAQPDRFAWLRCLLRPAAARQPCRDRNAAVLTRFWQVVEQNLRLPLRDAST